jgi:hypothetical protein
MTEFLKSYQSLIVGIIGFGGVIATLVANASIARRNEAYRAAREREALRNALVEELKIIKNIFRERMENFAEDQRRAKQAGELVPARFATDVFAKSIDRLGLLYPEEIRAVLGAYIPLAELGSRLRLLESRTPLEERQVEFGLPSADYVYIGKAELPALLGLHETFSKPVTMALNVLESRLAK